MTPEKWKQVKLLFEELITLEPLEEKKYLDSCQDEEIRKELESLLNAHRNANNFLPEKEPLHSNENGQNLKDYNQSTGSTSNSRANIKQKDFTGTSRFLIQKRLGEGGFGVVYQAYDRERHSIVALKTLHRADAEDLYRFKKEFRGLADIAHQNLAAMYELFSEEDQWFFTMEMIYGKNFLDYVKAPTLTNSSSNIATAPVLKELISREDITKADSLEENIQKSTQEISYKDTKSVESCSEVDLIKLRRVLKQLAEGLYALHQAGKLHRDLKPSNVLVTNEGRVVILDFGLISDLTSQGVNQVTSDNIMGTPAYMSPEHISGQAISPASDWYSVGIMLYLALTGKLPFSGNPTEILLAKQRREVLPPSELVSGIPEDLNNLCQDLLKRNPRLRPNGAEILRCLGDQESIIPPPTGNLIKPSALFVGREQELSKLNQAWQLIKQGKGATVYIKGRSGMGKSTIVRHFLEKLEQSEGDLLIFSGRCYEQELVPYKVIDSIIDLLSKYLKSLSNLEVEALLPLDILALARLFPVLRQVEAIANSRRNIDSPDSQDLRRKAFSALRELLARLANKKDVVLFIDDLQWGDLDSVGLLLEIIRPPDAPRLLLIGSYRSEEADNSLFLKALFSSQNANEKAEIQEITVEELSKEESEKLAIALLGQEGALQQTEIIVKESGGSPFFIGELAQYALTKKQLMDQENGQSEMTIDKVVNARISQLSKEAHRFLEVVAVSGQPLTRNVAKRVAEIAGDEQILSILRTNHLLRSTGTSTYEEIDTYHDRIRETILKNLSLETLKNYHYSLALALEADKVVDPERLAKHFQIAGNRDKASDYTIAAAQQADQALAFERAAQLYRQSLELKPSKDPSTTSIKIKLGNALSNAGQGAEAAKAYLAASTNSNRQELFKLQYKAAEQFLNAGHIDEGLDLLNVVLKKADMKLTNNRSILILSIILGRIKLWLKGFNYKECDESEISPKLLTAIDICWTATDSLVAIDVIQATYFQTKHILLTLKAGEPYRLVRALAFENIYSSLSGINNKTRTEKLSQKLVNLAKQVNKPELFAMANFSRSGVMYMYGDWQTSWELFKAGEKITQEECVGENYSFALRGIDNSITLALRNLFYLGNINELLLRLPPLLNDAEYRNNLFVLTNLNTIILYIKHLAADDPEKAYKDLGQVSDLWTKRGFHIQHYWRTLAYGEIGLYSGKGLVTWEQLKIHWVALKKSFTLKSQNSLIEALQLQARTALAASKEVANPETFLKIAQKNAKQILQEKSLYGDAWATLIIASVLAARGKRQLAIDSLVQAEKKFESANMGLYLAATRYRRGELLGNDEGKALISDSHNWISNQKIKNPGRMVNMLVPGKWL